MAETCIACPYLLQETTPQPVYMFPGHEQGSRLLQAATLVLYSLEANVVDSFERGLLAPDVQHLSPQGRVSTCHDVVMGKEPDSLAGTRPFVQIASVVGLQNARLPYPSSL
jgi:hypothetical protein